MTTSHGSQGAAVVIGAGDSVGAAAATAFAKSGLAVVPVRRQADGLAPLAQSIAAMGGKCLPVGADARDPDAVIALFDRVEREIGPVEVLVFNIGANAPRPVIDESWSRYRDIWESFTLAGVISAHEASKRMLKHGKGTIIFTGVAAALRGAEAPAGGMAEKFVLRSVAQGMARELKPKNVHVVHAVIDTVRDVPGTGSTLPADDIAAEFVRIHQLPPADWVEEVDLRPGHAQG